MSDLFMQTDACISECGLYRYWLSRTWDADKPPVCWVCLNPSTADATVDDPTIRRCIGFAQAWGHGGIVVVNLFAYRATDPKTLFDVYYRRQIGPGKFHSGDPVGPENDRIILEHTKGRRVIAAWGTKGVMMLRDQHVVRLLRDAGVKLECLVMTKDGHPKHPLYVAASTQPVPFGSSKRSDP